LNIKTFFCFFSLGLIVGFLSVPAWAQETVDPVNWRELVPFLVDFQGWDSEGDAEGTTMSMGTFSMSQVERSYSSGEKSFTINLVDGGYAPMAYAGIKMAMSMEIDTSDEYIKKLTVKEFPGIEKYNRPDQTADVIILISERFILQIEGENMGDTSDLIAVANQLDLEGIAKLGK
jgi:hypothetical protein